MTLLRKYLDTYGGDRGYAVVFIVNMICCFTGNGTVVWGNAITYRGMYYFKTDFASMISYFMVFYYIKNQRYSLFDYAMLILAGFLIISSNARIYYMIFTVLLCCVWLYKRNEKILSIKSCTWIVIFAIIGVLSVMVLPHLPIFENRQMITLEISGVEYNNIMAETANSGEVLTRNLQGRNNIWGPLFDAFREQGIITQLFGAGLSFNDVYGLEDFNEHSLYVKTILNTGYVGMLLWLLFLVLIVLYLGKEKNKQISFMCAMLIGIYSVAGISVPTNLFTSTSWLPLLYCGLICGIEKSQKTNNCK